MTQCFIRMSDILRKVPILGTYCIIYHSLLDTVEP